MKVDSCFGSWSLCIHISIYKNYTFRCLLVYMFHSVWYLPGRFKVLSRGKCAIPQGTERPGRREGLSRPGYLWTSSHVALRFSFQTGDLYIISWMADSPRALQADKVRRVGLTPSMHPERIFSPVASRVSVPFRNFHDRVQNANV